MRKYLLSIAVLVSLTFVESSFADDTYSSYDDIVRELSTSSSYEVDTAKEQEELIRIHGGFGFVTSRVNLELPTSLPDQATLQGYEFQLGIDLFSPKWIAMGAVRSFEPTDYSIGEIQLREFDLSVLYEGQLKNPFKYTIGGGLSSRYLDINGSFKEKFNRKNTTPASILHLGMDARLAKALSLGLHVTYRSALVSDTIDNGSADGMFRITGHF